jgi:hypothetical protein
MGRRGLVRELPDLRVCTTWPSWPRTIAQCAVQENTAPAASRSFPILRRRAARTQERDPACAENLCIGFAPFAPATVFGTVRGVVHDQQSARGLRRVSMAFHF